MTVVALLQLDHTVGDIDANVKSIENAVGIAQENGAELAVSSELAISGYPPRDLLEKHGFVRQCIEATKSIQVSIPTIVGTPIPPEAERTKPGNGAVRIIPGRPTRVVTQKQLLPTYDVFDEERYFHPDSKPGILRLLDGQNIGVTICEDAWQHAGLVPSDYSVDPIEQLSSFSIDGETLKMSLNLSSSPYHIEKQDTRAEVARCAAKTLEHPFLLCNQVGANDDLIFDGNSFIINKNGSKIKQLKSFSEDTSIWDMHENFNLVVEKKSSEISSIFDALVLGVKDYAKKCGFRSVLIGLSGGIDSALVAVIATAALGSENIFCVSMPSKWSSKHSKIDAKDLVERLNISLNTIPIENIMSSFEDAFVENLNFQAEGITNQNIQSRIRGTLLMALANQEKHLLLSTGNKSELAVGYCTLYGDMNGGLSVIGDLYKTNVFKLCKWLDNNDSVESRKKYKLDSRIKIIGDQICNKPPSAELGPDQFDTDSLPPYCLLDKILKGIIEEKKDLHILEQDGYTKEQILRIITLIKKAEFKRRQAPPILKLSSQSLGSDWRVPIAVSD